MIRSKQNTKIDKLTIMLIIGFIVNTIAILQTNILN